GRYLWCGTKEGDMFEYDIEAMRVTSTRMSAHTGPVLILQRVKDNMISIDESGKICTWLAKDQSLPSLKDPPVTQRIVIDKYSCTFVLGDEVWVASASDTAGSTSRTPRVRIYRPFTIDKPFNANSRPVGIPDNIGPSHLGLISSAALVPLQPDYVFLGHQSGHISIWNRFTYSCVYVQKLNMAGVTCLCGVRGHFLWAGSRQGEIRIFDVREQPWQVIKIWQANKAGAVTQMIVDASPIDDGKLQVLATSLEGEIHIWDGLLKTDWMTVELERRLTEYSTFRTLKTFHLTFNIDAATVMDFEGHELPGFELLEENDMPDVIVIGFQELVDLGDTRIMAKNLILGGGRKSKQADAGERLSHQARAWTQRLSVEVQRRFPDFKLLLQDSLVGLYTAIFVRESELSAIRDPGIATIKTGFGGRMGNKGAIVASMRIDDTPLAWINCHLAAGQRHVRQRNADLVNIFESTLSQKASNQKLDYEVDAYAGGGDGSMILPDHEIVFLSGDLNYRVDLRREQCFDLIRNEDWQGLMAKDQLQRQLKESPGHRLKPFREAAIQFAPTYKYDRQTDSYDTSEKQRVPAYCDRIMWYSRSEDAHAIQCLQYTSQPHIKMSDHRPVVAKFSFQIRKADPKRRKAVLDELLGDWQVAQAERLRAAREYYN
ncbi:DNase I-like protein, partial [Meira miltonrushii]